MPTFAETGTLETPNKPLTDPVKSFARLKVDDGDTSITVVWPPALIGASLTTPLAPVVVCVSVSPLTTATVPANSKVT